MQLWPKHSWKFALFGVVLLLGSAVAAGKAPSPALALPDLVRCIRPAVVFLSVARQGKVVSGTGFIVSPDGYVLTAHHLVKNARRIFVRLSNGTRHFARFVDAFEEMDVALLKLGTPSQKYPRVVLEAASDEPKQGEEILVFGYPGGRTLGVEDVTVTRGIVSAHRLGALLQIDASINPGNSGGPVVAMENGAVVGIVYARSPRFSGINFAVSIFFARYLLGKRNVSVELWHDPGLLLPENQKASACG